MVNFYSLEELEDESMVLVVKRFGNFRFRRNSEFVRSQIIIEGGGGGGGLNMMLVDFNLFAD